MEEGVLEIRAMATGFENLVGVAHSDCWPGLVWGAEASEPRLPHCAALMAKSELEGD